MTRQLKRRQWLWYHFIWQLLWVTSHRSVMLYTWSFTGYIRYELSCSWCDHFVWYMHAVQPPQEVSRKFHQQFTNTLKVFEQQVPFYDRKWTCRRHWMYCIHKTNVVHKNLKHKSWSKTTWRAGTFKECIPRNRAQLTQFGGQTWSQIRRYVNSQNNGFSTLILYTPQNDIKVNVWCGVLSVQWSLLGPFLSWEHKFR